MKELLEGSLLQQWRSERGSLRALLKTAFERHCVSQYRKDSAQKRGGDKQLTHLSLDLEWAAGRYAQSVIDPRSPEVIYDKEWAEASIAQAVENLANQYEGRGKMPEFQLLCQKLTDDSETECKISHREIAERLGTTEGNVKQKMLRFRENFKESLRGVIAETVENDRVQGELDYIFALMGR
jgi:DNA-directed RNA polymerase specialized sigma24 family protein